MVFINLLQDCGEFVTGLFQYARARCEICQRGWIELWLFRAVFPECLDGANGVVR